MGRDTDHDDGATVAGLGLVLRRRQSVLARQWYDAIAPTSFTAWSAADVHRHVETWVDATITALVRKPVELELARAIGARLADLRYLQPDALERTLALLGQQLVADLPPAAVSVLQPHVAALLGAIAAGFFRQAQTMLLTEQDSVHRALASERNEVAAALRESEARYRAIFEHSALGIALLNTTGSLLETNPALHVMLGYDADELRHHASTAITHPEDVAETRRLFHELVVGQRDHYQLDKRYVRKDGQIVWARLTVSLVRYASGQPHFAIALIENVTAEKRGKAELAGAHRRLQVAREAERVQLARELHDGPLQDLEGALFRLLTRAQTAARQRSQDVVPEVADKLREVIRTIRTICRELRPPVLVHYGLELAIRSHVDQVQAAHPGLNIHLELTPDGQRLPEAIRLALYRIFQQALQNVLQHAQARTIRIRFTLNEEQVVLEVHDDGCGFAVPENWIAAAQAGHIGLLGATERAELFRGRLEVRSQPGAGTQLRVTVPRQPFPIQ